MKYIYVLICAVSIIAAGCKKPQKPAPEAAPTTEVSAQGAVPYTGAVMKIWTESELPKDRSVLLSAIKNNAQTIAREKIALGKDLLTPDKEGFTPIYLAAQKGQLSILKMLIDQDVNPNSALSGKAAPTFAGICVQEDYKIYTPMHAAVEMGYSEVVRYMLARKVKVDDCLLFAAIKQGNPTTVEVLVEGGANKTVKTKQGKTPAEFAQELGKNDMLASLSNAAASKLLKE